MDSQWVWSTLPVRPHRLGLDSHRRRGRRGTALPTSRRHSPARWPPPRPAGTTATPRNRPRPRPLRGERRCRLRPSSRRRETRRNGPCRQCPSWRYRHNLRGAETGPISPIVNRDRELNCAVVPSLPNRKTYLLGWAGAHSTERAIAQLMGGEPCRRGADRAEGPEQPSSQDVRRGWFAGTTSVPLRRYSEGSRPSRGHRRA